jgi:hypothetical protein
MFAESLTPSPGIREHYLAHSGLDLLTLSSSHFDPQETSTGSRFFWVLRKAKLLSAAYMADWMEPFARTIDAAKKYGMSRRIAR